MKLLTLVLALLVTAMFAACSSTYATRPAMVASGVLTDNNGMTLYTFDKDVAGSGKSMCNGPCANNWPAFYAKDSDSASGDYSIITRDDGKKQWALKGKPLYYWSKDQKPGDMDGDGFKDVWHVVRP